MDVAARPLGDYAPACGAEAVERLTHAARAVEGARVLHVSAAGGGAGAADLLSALLPLASGAGVEVEWRVLFGGPELMDAAASLREGLQGAESATAEAGWRAYLAACEGAAAGIEGQ